MILIVDDEKDTVWILSEHLKANGYEVCGCNSGSSALKQAKKIKPEVVLLDYNLPDMDGVSVLKKLLKIKRNIKVIMISGTADPEIKEKAIKLGAFTYLDKPMDLGNLLGVVKKAMRRRI